MSCAKGTVYGPSKDNPNGTLYLRADCKRLQCPRCGEKRVRQYKKAIAERAGEHNLKRFMSLTLDPSKIDSSKDTVSYLRECFAKFRVYLGRRFGKKAVSFISIVELHKSGIAHLHVLVSLYIPQDWISKNWQAVGGGEIVDIRLVDIHRVAAYLSKYVTKQLLLLVPANKKRISTSRDIKLFPKKEKSGFKLLDEGINYLWETITGGWIGEHSFDEDGLRSFILWKNEGEYA